jgi:hypothetical protein
VALAAACALALVWRDYSGREAEVRKDYSGREAQVRSIPGCEGNWSECAPGALWLRDVVARTGYGNVNAAASALLLSTEGLTGLYFWTVRDVSRRNPPACSPYAELPRVGKTEICGNRGFLSWHVQGWKVFLKPAPDPHRLAQLVRFTEIVPAP